MHCFSHCTFLLLNLYIRVVRYLVHKYPPSLTVKDKEGNTALYLAAMSGSME